MQLDSRILSSPPTDSLRRRLEPYNLPKNAVNDAINAYLASASELRQLHQQSCICLIGLKSGRSGRFRPIRRSGRWTEFSRFLPEFSPTFLGPALSDVDNSDRTDPVQSLAQTLFRSFIGRSQAVSLPQNTHFSGHFNQTVVASKMNVLKAI